MDLSVDGVNKSLNFGGTPVFYAPEKAYFHAPKEAFAERADVYRLDIMCNLLCEAKKLIKFFSHAENREQTHTWLLRNLLPCGNTKHDSRFHIWQEN